jgi:DNA-binding NarL/FixJ family response regulator
MITDYLGRYLCAHTGCEIVTAMMPNDILRQIAERPVPVVICDDTAPSMRTFELMGEIKARSPQTQVVLIVPSGSSDQERRAKAAGADMYVPHSFAFKHLQRILDDVLA